MPKHQLAPDERALQLRVPLVLPGVDDAQDGCVGRLTERLQGQTGVKGAHLDEDESGRAVLCLHYNPNLVPLEKLERLARDEGARLTARFRHETLPVKGMDCGSCAASIEHVVRKIAGVTNVNVSYTTQKLKVEFDSEQTNRDAIIKAVSRLGYRVPMGTPLPLSSVHHPHEHGPDCNHDHDEHAHHEHAHSHAEDDPNASWIARHPELVRSLVSGLLLLVGFVGERFFGLPPSVALAFYLGAYVSGGYDLARHTVPATLHGRFDVEFLMLLGAIGAGILGQWAEGAFLLFLFSLGHALEGFALDSARRAIGALGKIAPATARVKRSGTEVEVPVEQVQVGEVVVVRPGDRVPVDGTVVAGHSSVDQSALTGESLPLEKGVGAGVFAGSINGEGALEIETSRLSGDTTIARVVQMVEEAQSQKAPSQTFAEKFERILVPSVLGIALLAAIVPPLAGWLLWKDALIRAISTVVAASPCALALATPSAVLAAIARAAQNGVLIKGGVHLETLGSVRAFAFDKTGTLSRGRPEIVAVQTVGAITRAELLQMAASVELRSSHPLAGAVVRAAQTQNLALSEAQDVQIVPGKGVFAQLGGHTLRLGNIALMEEANVELSNELKGRLESWGEAGHPTMIVARGAQVVGAFAFADALRLEARPMLEALRAQNVSPLVMLSGDNDRVANRVAAQLSLTEVRANLLPADKVAAIRDLMLQHEVVAMVGDGVNDAPALASASVGIAMGAGGSDVALETADVALVGDDLSKIPFAVALSRQAKGIIRQNLWISLGVICLLVPSTLFGFARLGVAVAFHEGSTLVVVFNALRLLRFRMK